MVYKEDTYKIPQSFNLNTRLARKYRSTHSDGYLRLHIEVTKEVLSNNKHELNRDESSIIIA